MNWTDHQNIVKKGTLSTTQSSENVLFPSDDTSAFGWIGVLISSCCNAIFLAKVNYNSYNWWRTQEGEGKPATCQLAVREVARKNKWAADR